MTKPALRPYQNRGVSFLEKLRYVLMLLPMGAGKTAIVCSWIARWDMKVLVVAPLRVAETVWPSELQLWASGVGFRVVTGNATRRAQAMRESAPVTIVNYDNLVWFLENTELDYDAIVFDELTNMKNWSAKRFKAYIKRRKKFETVIGLTGTLTSKGIKDIYAQVRCIDGGSRLGKTLTAFRAAFMIKGYMDWDWKPRPFALKTIMRKISGIVFTVTDEEYLATLPQLHTNVVEVDLPKDAREAYDELNKEYIAEFGNDLIITPNSATLVNKLQQIAGGFAYTGGYLNHLREQPGKVEATHIHDAKLNALGEIIDSQQGEPLIVVYKYRHELEAMRRRFPGTVMNEGSATSNVETWNRRGIPILYLHPRSAGHGLNLQKGGNTLVWFSLTWSWEEYVQVIARLLRSGQDRPVFNHLIMAKDTVDGDIFERVESEAATDDTMMTWLKERQL